MQFGDGLSCEGGTAQEEVANAALETEASGTGTPSDVEKVELQNMHKSKLCYNELHAGT